MPQFDPEAGPQTAEERFDEIVSLLQCGMLAIDDSHERCADPDECQICDARQAIQKWLRDNKVELVEVEDYFPNQAENGS